MSKHLSITNETKSNPPISGLLFVKMKDEILGKNYALSLAFVSASEIQKLNLIYRKKDMPTDVLSFSYGKQEGEILICEKIAREKAAAFSRAPRAHLIFLFIHALLHLKGMLHGSRMEAQEAKWLKKFQSA